MPRFFFNLHNNVSVEDREGKELPDIDRARDQAITHARGIMSEDVKDGRLVLKDEIEVLDESRARLLTVRFRDAVEIEQ
jgi:hypothetical protein